MRYLAESKKAQEILKSSHGIDLNPSEIYGTLIDYFNLDIDTELLWKQLTAEQMVSILRTHKPSWSHVIGTIDLEQSILPSDCLGYFEKAIVKSAGEQWTIHKYDRDVFPSNPHAHNYARRLKMHLGTGELFTRSGQLAGKVSRKKFLGFRSKISRQIPTLELPILSL